MSALDLAGIVPFEALSKATGYNRPSDVERCLRKQGIIVFHGKNGPWTTLMLLNAAGGIGTIPAEPHHGSDDIL